MVLAPLDRRVPGRSDAGPASLADGGVGPATATQLANAKASFDRAAT